VERVENTHPVTPHWTFILTIAWLSLALSSGACAGAGDAAPSLDTPAAASTAVPSDMSAPMSEARVEWSLRRSDDGSHLVVEYQVVGGPEQPFYLLDRVLLRGAGGVLTGADDRVIVLPGERAGDVRFIRGFVRGQRVRGRSIEIIPAPAGRLVEFGQTVEGSARVALPLGSWHNFEQADALTGTPSMAVLELGYLVGDSSWTRKRLSDGSEVTVPQPPQVPAQRWLRGAPIELPPR
jgi:hypothetical protein